MTLQMPATFFRKDCFAVWYFPRAAILAIILYRLITSPWSLTIARIVFKFLKGILKKILTSLKSYVKAKQTKKSYETVLLYLITSIILLGIARNVAVTLSNRSCTRFFMYSSSVMLSGNDAKEILYGAWVNISTNNI